MIQTNFKHSYFWQKKKLSLVKTFFCNFYLQTLFCVWNGGFLCALPLESSPYTGTNIRDKLSGSMIDVRIYVLSEHKHCAVLRPGTNWIASGWWVGELIQKRYKLSECWVDLRQWRSWFSHIGCYQNNSGAPVETNWGNFVCVGLASRRHRWKPGENVA